MEAQRKANIIRLLAKGDDQYYELLKEHKILERKYDCLLESLPPEVQDTICDFISKNEEISWRLLEIACEHMEFRD